jgi:hypothetical protein
MYAMRLAAAALLGFSVLQVVATTDEGATDKPSAPPAPANADCPCRGKGRYGCPLYPIGVLSNGTLYFAEYFEPDCDAESTPTYVFGDYAWPWQMCPDDCGEFAASSKSAAQGFEGLPGKVGFDYMHEHEGGNALTMIDGQRDRQSCFPGGPARHCCRVNQDLNHLCLKFNVNGKRYAKVLQLEVNVEKAAFQPDLDHWKTTYVAFEVEGKPPTSEGYETIPAQDLDDVKPTPNPYVKMAAFRKGPGQVAKVLILLSK